MLLDMRVCPRVSVLIYLLFSLHVTLDVSKKYKLVWSSVTMLTEGQANLTLHLAAEVTLVIPLSSPISEACVSAILSFSRPIFNLVDHKSREYVPFSKVTLGPITAALDAGSIENGNKTCAMMKFYYNDARAG